MKRDVYLNEQPLEEALQNYIYYLQQKGVLTPGKTETILAENALGRVTAAPIYARVSSPHYNAASMDGIAVKSSNTFGASDADPEELQMGDDVKEVDTGDPLPEGCDAVIMIEDVQFTGEKTLEIIAPAVPWQHVRVIGEDLVTTEMILPANHRLRPVDIGAILAGGVTEIQVHPRPRVGLLPTGTELVQPGQELGAGSIVEYNTRVLGNMLQQWGAEPVRWKITADKYESIKSMLERALEDSDIVLINAGSSAGREDYTAQLIEEMGTVLTHGVAIKPGKPVVLGEIYGKPVMGIPGYPVSAFLDTNLFVKPVIYNKLASYCPEPVKQQVKASRKIVSSMGTEEFVRVKMGKVGEKFIATPIARGAGIITSMVRADGMLRIPRLSEGYNSGDTIEVELMRPLEEVQETTVAIGSHDMALDVLANYLRQRYPEATLSSAHVGSLGGLNALKRKEAHLGGTHLLDEETGDYNVSYIKKIIPDDEIVLVNLVYRQQGFIVARGNPKKIQGVKDLSREDISYINRQRGAGTRVLFDYKLKENNIDPAAVQGYEREEYTHMTVAAAVASSTADAGMGILAAAKALDLDFIPVVEERYDLCIPADFYNTPYIQRLIEVIQMPEFQKAVEGMGGYDLRDCGKIMWSSS
ncbi:MAG: molybdopterin biosynthesis protein [Clostridiales bacterium]|nr:molybdopterin biosynthesis protein [Clostridiales bacterium]MCF8022061.1 molybdopterin biosynthesis protein [Clostridiales bacterium]